MNTAGKTMTLVFLLMTVIAAFAQSGKSTPEERAQRWDNWMKEQLALTPEQQAQAKEINLRYAKQNEELKTTEASKRSKFQNLKSTDKDKDEELKRIFTKDQFDTYLVKKKEFQKQMLQSYKQ